MEQEQPPAQPLAASAALLVLTPLLGIAVRFTNSGLPWPVRKYGGSVLWAAMVYWVASTFVRRTRLPVVALGAEIIAVSVEFFKLVHTHAIDAFRGTLAGVLLLGREFSYADILAYTVAIGLACMADAWMRKKPARKKRQGPR